MGIWFRIFGGAMVVLIFGGCCGCEKKKVYGRKKEQIDQCRKKKSLSLCYKYYLSLC
jgi:hypothetical protein